MSGPLAMALVFVFTMAIGVPIIFSAGIATVAGLTTLAGVATGKIGNPISSVTNFLKGNPGAADDVAKSTFFKKDHINNGGSPLPEIISAAYEAQTFEDKKAAREKAISNASSSSLGSTLFT